MYGVVYTIFKHSARVRYVPSCDNTRRTGRGPCKPEPSENRDRRTQALSAWPSCESVVHLPPFVASLRRDWHWLVLVVLGIANFWIRFTALGRYAALPSPDYGLYLAQAHLLAGADVAQTGPTLPPLTMALLLGLLQVVDPMTALRVFSATPGALLPLPFFFLVSRYAQRSIGLVATAVFVFAEGYSEMSAWGGAPEFFAITCMLGAFVFLLRYLGNPSRRDLVLAALLASFTVGAHQLSASILVLSVAGWVGLELVRRRSWTVLPAFLRFAGLAALLCLPYLPSYLAISAGLGSPLTPIWPNAFSDAVQSIVFLTRDTPLLWAGIGVMAGIGGAAVLRSRPEGTLIGALSVVSFALSVTAVRDNPARPLYYAYIPLLAGYPAFHEWAFTKEIPRLDPTSARPLAAGIAAFLVISSATMVGLSIGRLTLAVEFYHAIETPELEGLDWLRENTPADSVVATAGLPFSIQPEGTRFAWWIEGYAERKAFFAGSLIYASYADERAMVTGANRFFTGNHVLDNGAVRVVENFPADHANPEIWVAQGDVDRFAFFFNDAVSVVTYENATQPGVNASWSPAYDTPGSARRIGNASLEAERTGPYASLNRTVTLADDIVSVVVRASAANGTVLALEAPVWLGWGLLLEDVAVVAGGVTGAVRGADGTDVPFELTVSASPAATLRIDPTDSDPTYALAAILIDAVSGAPGGSLTVTLAFRFPGVVAGPAEAWDALPIARAYGVSYVYQSKRLPDMFNRFYFDRANFILRFENERVGIFQVR